MVKNPKISVLMPVYNCEKYLDRAIGSILDQTLKDFEFIIVDDYSTDKSWDIIKEYTRKDKRIVSFRNATHLRATKTLNKGLKIAKGKYIARMDGDDWSYPDRLQKQFVFMEKHPFVGVSGGTIEICDQHLRRLNIRKYPLSDHKAREIIFRYSPFAHPATIWRRDLLNKVHGYNENIPLGQDYELYFRIGRICKFANISDVLLKLRIHDNSSSITRGKFQEQFALYARIKAFMEYGYEMRTFDRIYTFLQVLSVGLIPPKIKFWLFNFIRRML